MSASNAELASAVTDVLTASRHFRRLYGLATPEQQELVMAGFPWPKRSLELRELTAWADIAARDLRAEDSASTPGTTRR
jgi:hypothetical protein